MSKLSNILSARSSQGPSDNFKNLIINGAMQVAQRGTSVTSITASGYRTVDRWLYEPYLSGTWTMSVENDAPTGSGFRKSSKVLCTTANNSLAVNASNKFLQKIEGQNLQAIKKGTASAEQLTVSFWVKSNVTGTYITELVDSDNNRQVSASYSIASSGTWEKKTIVFPADTTGAFDNDNGASLFLNFWLGAGTNSTSGTLNTTWASYTAANTAVGQTNLAAATNNYWQVTGVQLEVGAVATPFEFKPFAQDLRQCQRYFEKSYLYATALGTATDVGRLSAYKPSFTNGSQFYKVNFNTPKRAAPTMTSYSTNSGASGNLYITSPAGNHGTNPYSQITEFGFEFGTTSNITNSGGLIRSQYKAEAEI